MALVDWSDRYSVGVSSLDAQHKQLIGVLNELHEAMAAARGKQVQKGLIERLSTYANQHFQNEERMMRSAGMDFSAHKAQHEAYSQRMKQFHDEANGDLSLSVPLMGFLREWWTEHILKCDKEYTAPLQASGVQ